MQWVQTGNNDAIQTEQTSSPTIWQQFRVTQKHQQITIWQLLRVPQTSTHHYLAATHWWTTNGTPKSSIWQRVGTSINFRLTSSFRYSCVFDFHLKGPTNICQVNTRSWALVIGDGFLRDKLLYKVGLHKQTTTGIHTSSYGLFHSYLGKGNKRERR